MSKKSKLEKFSDNQQSENVVEPGKPIYDSIQGGWRHFFGNDNDIVIELACGRGEYTVGLAEKFPERNFVGIDVKGDRVWKGSQYAQENGLANVAFLRTHIINLDDCFALGEVSEIWLTFPDPQPKDRNIKHRLTYPSFIHKYQKVLTKGGWFKFKTDSTDLFNYTMEVLEDFKITDLQYTFDLYHSELLSDHYGLKTKYEQIWTNKGETIKYLKFRFDD